MLTMGMKGAIDKAKHKKTIAVIEQIKTALNSYHAEFKDYPPDGYDAETGWPSNNAGIQVGEPNRRVKGSAALIYFLCRPLIKVTILGDDPLDERNQRRTRVGPFLDTTPDSFSRREFNAGHPWADNDYWGRANQGYILTMLIDAYTRPICYDKVKTIFRS